MDRTSADGHINRRFYDGNLDTNTRSTILDATWLNGVQEELIGIIESAGIDPAVSYQNQVLTALARHAANMNFYSAAHSGTTNTVEYTLTRQPPYPPTPAAAAYTSGTAARFIVPSASKAMTSAKRGPNGVTKTIKFYDHTGTLADVYEGLLIAGTTALIVFSVELDAWLLDVGSEHLSWSSMQSVVDTALGSGQYNPAQPAQLIKSIAHHVATATHYSTATESGNTYTITPVDGQRANYNATSYPDGLRVTFFSPAASGQSAASPQANLIDGPEKVIRPAVGEDLPAGAIDAGELVTLTYNTSADAWLLHDPHKPLSDRTSAIGPENGARFLWHGGGEPYERWSEPFESYKYIDTPPADVYFDFSEATVLYNNIEGLENDTDALLLNFSNATIYLHLSAVGAGLAHRYIDVLDGDANRLRRVEYNLRGQLEYRSLLFAIYSVNVDEAWDATDARRKLRFLFTKPDPVTDHVAIQCRHLGCVSQYQLDAFVVPNI